MTTFTKLSRQFSDLNLMFSPHPLSGDVVKVFDDNAVKKSILHLILMKPFDVPFHPEVSCQANNLLFELATPVTEELIKKTIIDVLTKFEPRAQIISIDVEDQSDQNAYRITVNFVVVGTERPITVSTLLNRTR